ncbi:MAG: bifunctional nuclease family protein [Candidatus Edwardsbacteria bacterium]
MLEMHVVGLGLDANQNPVVLLREINGETVLPIWIGPAEATAIAAALQDVKIERPLTHDLMKTIIEGLKAKVTKVIISDLKDNTFYAKVILEKEESFISIDARPSDSIALALRTKSPIFVSLKVLGRPSEETTKEEEPEKESLSEYLKRLNPEDLGKFRV